MDLGSRLANLSLAEIASMLNAKQQEVLLASITVAANYIQQLQAEEQRQQAEDLRQQDRQQAEQEQQYQQQQHEAESMLSDRDATEQEQQYQDEEEMRSELDTQTDDDNFTHDNSYDTLHSSSSSTDPQTLTTIREFAEDLKHRRKLIRLSQKGAAQSLRAFTGGEQPCTDAIIYHFENLQLEPERAIQLIPLLRDWLEWAEKHRLSGTSLPMMAAVSKVPRERKRKVILFNEKAKLCLEDAFLKNNHPDRYQLEVISQELNIPTRSIRKWFTNRRQRSRFAEKFAAVLDNSKTSTLSN